MPDEKAASVRVFIGHKRAIPPHCDLCRNDDLGQTFASWWHPALNMYLCNEHSDAEMAA